MSPPRSLKRRAPVDRLPTVLDVARAAGVSKTTVSEVIREQGSVAATTRARVLEAIETLGYRPNIAARSLKLQRTDVLGVVAGNFFDPFNAEVTAHLEREAAANGFRILLATAGDEREGEASGVQSLLEYRVAALIFLGFSGSGRVEAMLRATTPTVFIATRSRYGTSICIDDRKGGELATRHLVELGHRRIAYVSTTFAGLAQIDRARIAGYRRALRRADIEPSDELILSLGATPEPERARLLRRLLARRRRPTAIFAASDITAIEILRYADELDICVPDQLSIVGFDNIALAGLARISLTTVAQPIADFARRAVATAVSQLHEPEPPGPSTTSPTEPELIVRQSTAAWR